MNRCEPRRVARPPAWLILGAPIALLALGGWSLVGDCPLEASRGTTTAPIRAGVAPLTSAGR